MTRSIPWPRILAEGFAIVVSILLAFGIQAWWEERQEHRLRLELFSTMLESARLDRASLTQNIRESEANQLWASEFFERSREELAAVPRDSASLFLNSITQPNTSEFGGGPLSRALEGGQLVLVEDPRLVTALDAWANNVTELGERSRSLADLSLGVLEGLGAHEPYQRMNFLGLGRRGSLPKPDDPQPYVGGLPDAVDLRPVRDDPRVMAPATGLAQQRRVYLRFATQLDSVLAGLEELLQSLLAETA